MYQQALLTRLIMDKKTLVDEATTFDCKFDQVETIPLAFPQQPPVKEPLAQFTPLSSVVPQSSLETGQINSVIDETNKHDFEGCDFNKWDAKGELDINDGDDHAVGDGSLKKRRIDADTNSGERGLLKAIQTQKDLDEMLFKCQFSGCDKKFEFEHQLTYHIRVHTRKKPYKCSWNGCHQEPFPNATHFITHTLNTHIFKTYQCPWVGCGKLFGGNYVTNHLRVHHSERSPLLLPLNRPKHHLAKNLV